MPIKELFNNTKLKKKLTTYNIEATKIDKAKKICSRWFKDVDLTKEKEHQVSFLREFFVRLFIFSP